MLKKTISVLGLVLLVGVSSSLAKYQENELQVWGMLGDTAYTLDASEWNLGIYGPVNYGITKKLQVGMLFTAFFAQIPNINVKYNLISETEVLPAISLGGVFASLDYVTNDEQEISLSGYGFSAYITKKMSEAIYLSGSYTYFGVGASKAIINPSDGILIEKLASDGYIQFITVDGIYNMGDTARFFGETIFGLLGEKSEIAFGAGLEWAMGITWRLKIGVYVLPDDLQGEFEGPLFPFVDLHWRFK